jgi:hypothetical protein
LASKYAGYRHGVAARCNGNPNERTMFHFAPPAVMPKIWQQGEGHDPRLSIWAEVGKGAYFTKHVMYCYAHKYFLWPSESKPEPPIGESMQVFASLVCLGNVADMGPGCETCISLAWEAWKKELPIMPKPTRPPATTLPADAAEKQHVLDLMQVKDAPRSDSVMSTEGDLGTHIASTSKDASGRHICDVMHPRLRARAREWAEQCVLFETAASYPMYIATLTKTRDSPMGPQQLMDAGCDANRIKALGFTASHIKALGKNTREMRAAGWSAPHMKGAGFDAGSLWAGGYSTSELKSADFSASQMKDAGCSVQQLKPIFTLVELKAAYDIPSLRSAGYSLSEMKDAGFSASSLKTVGCGAQELKLAGFPLNELQSAGFNFTALGQAQFEARALKTAGFTALQLQQAGYSAQQLHSGGYDANELITIGYNIQSLLTAGYCVGQLRTAAGFTALQLQQAGCSAQQLYSGGYDANELITIGYNIQSLLTAGYCVGQLRRAGCGYNEMKSAGCSDDKLTEGGYFDLKHFFPCTCDVLRRRGSTGSDNFVFNPDVVVLDPVNVCIFIFFPISLLFFALDILLLFFKIPLFCFRRFH